MEVSKADFLEAGVQFGHYKNQWHPKMKEFIFSTKNQVHIMDLKKIFDYSQKVFEQVKDLSLSGKTILFLCRKKQAQDLMKNAAIGVNCPYLVKEWPGGFLTNFAVISKEINKLQSLQKLIASDRFKGLLKKEQVRIDKKFNSLRESYEGVSNLKAIPDVLFIIGLKSEITAVREARILNIPIISVCDTDTNPEIADYMIPGNDDGIKSTAFFIKFITSAIEEGQNLRLSAEKITNENVKNIDNEEQENGSSL